MPRISTDNYDTVASWNGSQDLLVVEQPDGTKVATPAMVKQFIEAGDFEATGEVIDGHGNKLADVAAEIGDLSQTGVTGATVAAQLSQLDDDIDEKTQNTLKYEEAGAPSAAVIERGGCIIHNTGYLSIAKARLGLGLCMDEGDNTKYLIALLYRATKNDTVKFVEISKNGLYISATNNQGTAAVAGNTGTRHCYTIVFN